MKENIVANGGLLRTGEEVGGPFPPTRGGRSPLHGDDDGRKGVSGWKELARSFFRLYGRFPAVPRGNGLSPGCKAGNDGGNYPEHGITQRELLLVAGEAPAPGDLLATGPQGRDSPPLPHLRDCLLVERIKRDYASARTPFIVFDIDRLLENFRLLSGSLGEMEIFYPVKCNDHRGILELLRDWGSGFEAASWGEIRKLLEIGVEPQRIIFGAPVKVEEHISLAYREGIDLFAYDSYMEIAKLAAAAPGCRVYLRLAVPDHNASVFPLAKKFGASPREAVALLGAAEAAGLRPEGLSFHVGSQCLDPSVWWLAVAAAAWVWNRARAAGMDLRLLNMGGGIPVSYSYDVLGKEVFLGSLNLAVRGHFHRRPRLIIEPGRSLVGDAAVMVASVIGKACRDGREWLYLDAGTYHGLVEAVQERERFSYLVYSQGRGPLRKYFLGGPTCDAGDVVARDVVLPELHCGDRVYIMSAGAYTNVCSTTFNGFEPPEVYFMSSEG